MSIIYDFKTVNQSAKDISSHTFDWMENRPHHPCMVRTDDVGTDDRLKPARIGKSRHRRRYGATCGFGNGMTAHASPGARITCR